MANQKDPPWLHVRKARKEAAEKAARHALDGWPLGLLPDAEVARRARVSVGAVRRARTQKGIPAFRRRQSTDEDLMARAERAVLTGGCSVEEAATVFGVKTLPLRRRVDPGWRLVEARRRERAKREARRYAWAARGIRRADGAAYTYDDYEAALERQGGVCAVCGAGGGSRALHLDHCHDSGLARGILCGNCNTGIGKLRDDPDLLRKAIAYLEGE